MEAGLVLAVVNAGVPGGQEEQRAIGEQAGQGLGDLGGRAAHRLGGQLYGGAGDLKESDAAVQPKLGEVGPGAFQRYGDPS